MRRTIAVLAAGLFVFVALAGAKDEPQWIRLSSDHFTVLTDAGEKKGHEVIVRFEQMRGLFSQLLSKSKVNMSLPIDIIALKNDKEYAAVAPIRDGKPIDAPAFFVAGDDRIFIVLDAFEEEAWRAVAHQMAHYFLTYNYPPTPAWFDEGFAEYFSSARFDAKGVQIGADPELGLMWKQDLIGNQIEQRNVPKSLTELLDGPVWLSMPDLFAMKHNVVSYREGAHNTLFYAQSWITMHFLLNTNRLAQTGMLFDLVLNQRVPVNDAIPKAYGMTAAQFDDAVKKYFRAQQPLFIALDRSRQQGTLDAGGQMTSLPLPVSGDEVGSSRLDLTDLLGPALVAEMTLRLPEHRAQALQDLQKMIDEPKGDTSVVHRALAWASLEKNEFDAANEELVKASDLDRNDPWVHYYSALTKYRRARATGQPTQGLANAMIDLRVVIDWNPSFAEAYGMLGCFRLEGGGLNSAMESTRAAIQLSPRNQEYRLDLANIYIAGKKWDDATAMLEELKGSPDAQVARAARKDLDDLPTLKKYGVLPQSETQAKTQVPSKLVGGDTSEDEGEEKSPVEEKPDTRPVVFLKGKLVSVDCSHSPAAVLTLSAGSKKTLKLRTDDFKSLALLGADQFSCSWRNVPVSVNYKAGGKSDGDLVSVEVE